MHPPVAGPVETDVDVRIVLTGVDDEDIIAGQADKGGTPLAFCLKALSRKGCVWVNGLTLRFLEQVPLSVVNRVAFSGIQMVVRQTANQTL